MPSNAKLREQLNTAKKLAWGYARKIDNLSNTQRKCEYALRTVRNTLRTRQDLIIDYRRDAEHYAREHDKAVALLDRCMPFLAGIITAGSTNSQIAPLLAEVTTATHPAPTK